MRKFRITVALCVYNGGPYLARLLASLKKQTLFPDELIVVNDASQDNSAEILQEFSRTAHFPVRILTHEKNRGYRQALATALAEIHEGLIFPCDHDDEWLPEKLARMVARFEARPELGAIASDMILGDGELHEKRGTLWQANRQQEFAPALATEQGFALELRQNFAAATAMGFQQKYLAYALPLSDLWVHDGWIFSLITAMAPVEAMLEPTVFYRVHAQQSVGAEPTSFWAALRFRLQRGLKKGPALVSQRRRELEELETRINNIYSHASAEERARLDRSRPVLRRHLEHFRIRERALAGSRVRRFALLSREWGRYQTCDNGLSSLVKDLLSSPGKGLP